MGIRAERMTRMATIEIKMLGGFEIRVNGKPVLAQLAQSRKATALVQYLVLRRGERVSHKVLTDTLWAGERSTNPDMALRAILHRFRLMIDAEGLEEMKDCIVTSRGYYQWNPHLDCSVDVFEVNDLSELARKESDAEKRSRIYEQIVNLYDGRLLPQSASEPWVESVSVRLHGQYRTAILNLLELCKKWGESTRIVTLCTRALELDPYEERLYLEKIVALETLGRHEEAEDLARRGSAMGCLHHAIEPGRAGSAYRQMRQADRNMESEVSKLISALPDTEDTGACICDFETFKEIYRTARRAGPLRSAGIPGDPDRGSQPEHRCCRDRSDGGAAGRSDPHESAPVRCGRPLHRYAVCCYAERQYRRERHRPAGAHQGRVLPRPCPWTLPVEL